MFMLYNEKTGEKNFYDTKEEVIETLEAFEECGFERNDFTVYVAYTPDEFDCYFQKGDSCGSPSFCGGVRRTPPNYCTPPARKNQEKIGEWTRHRIIPKPQVRALFDQLWRNCEEEYFLKKCLTIRANESIILNVRRGKRKTSRG